MPGFLCGHQGLNLGLHGKHCSLNHFPSSRVCPYTCHSVCVEVRETCPYTCHNASMEIREACPYTHHSTCVEIREACPYTRHSTCMKIREACLYTCHSLCVELTESPLPQCGPCRVKADQLPSSHLTGLSVFKTAFFGSLLWACRISLWLSFPQE